MNVKTKLSIIRNMNRRLLWETNKGKKKKEGSRTCCLPGWPSLDAEKAAGCSVCLLQSPRSPHHLRTESLATTSCTILHTSTALDAKNIYQLWLHVNSKPSIIQIDLSFRSSETKNRWCVLCIVCNYFLPSVRMRSFSVFIETAQIRATWLNYEFYLSSYSSLQIYH